MSAAEKFSTGNQDFLKRRLPRVKELAPLFDLSLKSRKATQLQRCADISDLRKLAYKRVPHMVFDFVDGAAGSELSLIRARELFRHVELQPRALVDVSNVDTKVNFLGKESSLPFFFAPTGGTRLMHAGGESIVGSVAGKNNIPYALSTLGNTSIETLRSNAPDSRLWFQLYMTKDRSHSEQLLKRAVEQGFDTLLVAIDCPVPGRRNRDVRNGLVVPPKTTWDSVFKIMGYPSWWFDKLTTPPIEFALIDAMSESPQQRMAKTFDPRVTIEDIKWLRKIWDGMLVAKGVQSVDDAEILAANGVDGVYLSTHGGRQLDLAPLPLELLPEVKKRVGNKVDVFVDGGIMTGAEIVACYAAGADGVGVGRAYLYGLMAAGSTGVQKVIDILAAEVKTTMALIGCQTLSDVANRGITIRPN